MLVQQCGWRTSVDFLRLSGSCARRTCQGCGTWKEPYITGLYSHWEAELKYRIAAVCWHRVVKLHLLVFGHNQCCTSTRQLPAHQGDDASSRRGFSPPFESAGCHAEIDGTNAEVVYIALSAEARLSEEITPREDGTVCGAVTARFV